MAKRSTRRSERSEPETGELPEILNGHRDRDDGGRRLNIQLDADGHIAWDRLQDRTRATLRSALEHEPTTAPASSPAPAGGSRADLEATAGVLWGVVGLMLQTTIKAAGYPDDQAATLKFAADELAVLAPQTAEVLARHSHVMGKWDAEIMLAVSACSIVGAKLAALKKPARVVDFPTGRNVTTYDGSEGEPS